LSVSRDKKVSVLGEKEQCIPIKASGQKFTIILIIYAEFL